MNKLKTNIFILALPVYLFITSGVLFGEYINITPPAAALTASKIESIIMDRDTHKISEEKYSVVGRFNASINFSPIAYTIIGGQTLKLSDKGILSLTESVLSDFNKNIDNLVNKINSIPPEIMNKLSADLQSKLQEDYLKTNGVSVALIEQMVKEFDAQGLQDSKKDILSALPYGLESIINGLAQKPAFPKAFGLMFSLDYKVSEWISPSVDIGFGVIERSVIGYLITIKTIPWSIGARIYPHRSGQYGFFLIPKFGGTYLSLSMKDIFNNEYIIRTKEHGLYFSLEMGYRILLFPKSRVNNRVQVGIDISFFDLGYYFNAWDTKILNTDILFLNKNFKMSDVLSGGADKILNIRALILPRIGISIRF